ncbi:hypothetical protein BC826DRAFT_1016462 [Russula brevipes]|nr:hypothetical protein BC826DRAFT_1016462 [Russula brevipes]
MRKSPWRVITVMLTFLLALVLVSAKFLFFPLSLSNALYMFLRKHSLQDQRGLWAYLPRYSLAL